MVFVATEPSTSPRGLKACQLGCAAPFPWRHTVYCQHELPGPSIRTHFVRAPSKQFCSRTYHLVHPTSHVSALSDFRAMARCSQVFARTHAKFLPGSQGPSYRKTSNPLQLLRDGRQRVKPSIPRASVKKQHARILRLYYIRV